MLFQLSLLFFSNSAVADGSRAPMLQNANASDVKAVADAAMDYALEGYPSSVKVRITVIKIIGDYAKVLITPLSAPGDILTAYMRKVNGQWVGIDIGTGINAQEEGIPKEVW